MRSLSVVQEEHRRLNLLQLLAAMPGYESSADVLYAVISVGSSLDQVVASLEWLADARRELVFVDPLGGLVMAKITQRGIDVSLGKILIDGVARPRPE